MCEFTNSLKSMFGHCHFLHPTLCWTDVVAVLTVTVCIPPSTASETVHTSLIRYSLMLQMSERQEQSCTVFTKQNIQ